MKETLEWLSTYFLRLRVGSVDASTFGLYPSWSAYAPSIARLLGHLAAEITKDTAPSSQRNVPADPEYG